MAGAVGFEPTIWDALSAQRPLSGLEPDAFDHSATPLLKIASQLLAKVYASTL